MIPGKVPAGHTARYNQVLAGHSELGQPQQAKDVVPSTTIQDQPICKLKAITILLHINF